MARSGSPPRKPKALKADEVVAYLTANPNFLNEHPELIDVLAPPSQNQADGVLDMQAFMIGRLQTELRTVQSRQNELLSASRVNLSSQERIHAAVLAVIEARTLEDIGRIVAEDYRSILDVSTSTLCFDEPGKSTLHNIISLAPGTIAEIMADRQILLRHDITGDERLYGDDAAQGALGRARADRCRQRRAERLAGLGQLRSRPFPSRSGYGTPRVHGTRDHWIAARRTQCRLTHHRRPGPPPPTPPRRLMTFSDRLPTSGNIRPTPLRPTGATLNRSLPLPGTTGAHR